LKKNSERQIAEVIESDPVADAIRRLLATRKRWKGTATNLLNELGELVGDNVRDRNWPKAANHLSRRLTALITPMNDIGIEIRIGKEAGGRLITLRKVK
jgi:hypothetical protein